MAFFKNLKNRARGLEKRIQGPMIPMPAPIPQEMSLPSIKPGFLDKRISSALPERPSPIPQEMSLNPISIPSFKLEKRISDELPPMMRGGAEFGPPSLKNILRNQAPGTVLDLETGLPPARLPEITRNIGNRPRRLPQIIPERMPSPRPTPRFFGGGLRNIFARLPDQRVRERMSPPLPRAPIPMPMPERMPMERFPMMRPGFAEGEGVDINRIIADQGAREGISPAERKAQSIREFLGETGRTVSNRDAELYGMGVLSFEDIMERAGPVTNRNLMQQEQMFFPQSESLDDILADLEKKN